MEKIYKYKTALIKFSFVLFCCLLSGCASRQAGKKEEGTELEFFAMDTFMRVLAYGEEESREAAVNAAKEEVERLEKLFSTESKTSEIAKVNALGEGAVSEDTLSLLKRAKELCTLTNGAFDISIYPLMQAWGFPEKTYHVPSDTEISELKKKVDAAQIIIDEENKRVCFGMEGMQIDLGGIAKGFASTRIMEIYRERGMVSGLVSLGGNVQVLGTKPDGSLWNIALQNPDGGEDYLGVLQIKNCAVITSGSYERYFEQDGVRYHHILDPATGYPADSEFVSVTVVSEDGTLADGLSTALFIMGKERAIQFWREYSEEFDAVLYTKDQELYITEGIAKVFSSTFPVNLIKQEP